MPTTLGYLVSNSRLKIGTKRSSRFEVLDLVWVSTSRERYHVQVCRSYLKRLPEGFFDETKECCKKHAAVVFLVILHKILDGQKKIIFRKKNR